MKEKNEYNNLSIVVLNYNGYTDTVNCLNKLIEFGYGSNIILVDHNDFTLIAALSAGFGRFTQASNIQSFTHSHEYQTVTNPEETSI